MSMVIMAAFWASAILINPLEKVCLRARFNSGNGAPLMAADVFEGLHRVFHIDPIAYSAHRAGINASTDDGLEKISVGDPVSKCLSIAPIGAAMAGREILWPNNTVDVSGFLSIGPTAFRMRILSLT